MVGGGEGGGGGGEGLLWENFYSWEETTIFLAGGRRGLSSIPPSGRNPAYIGFSLCLCIYIYMYIVYILYIYTYIHYT